MKLSMVTVALFCTATLSAQERPIFSEAGVEHLIDLSSDGFEAKPDISHDLKTLHYASSQEGGFGSLDLWFATRSAQGEPFGAPTNVTELNSVERDHTPTTNAALTYMVFSSSRDGGLGTDDAYETSRPDANSPWSAPVNLTVLNSDKRDMGFTITPDGLCLYMSSNRGTPGGPKEGSFDLYMSTRTSVDESWGRPEPVLSINTPFDEKFPSVTADNLTLYFASTRPGSELNESAEPSEDVWVAMRPDVDSPWTVIEPVFEFNTGFNEYLMSIADDHSEMFFVSDRPSSLGSYDLYRTMAVPGVTRFGAANDGAFGTPRIRSTGGAPALGNADFELEITRISPDGIGSLFVGTEAVGPLLVSLRAPFVRFVFQSDVMPFDETIAAPVPFDQSLLGLEFVLQAVVADVSGELQLGSVTVATTPGLRTVVQEN